MYWRGNLGKEGQKLGLFSIKFEGENSFFISYNFFCHVDNVSDVSNE